MTRTVAIDFGLDGRIYEAHAILAVDFAHVDTVRPAASTCSSSSSTVDVGCISPDHRQSNGAWVTQQARITRGRRRW